MLPKIILKLIEVVCRIYLTTTSTLSSRKELVSCEKLYLVKSTWGQNLINLHVSNNVDREMHEKKDCFGSNSYIHYNINGKDVEHCSVPSYSTWVI